MNITPRRLSNLKARIQRLLQLPAQMDDLRLAVGRVEAATARSRTGLSVRDHEFKVYSQWGEDGIIDHLVSSIAIAERSFVEFGVETYVEANTRFLLKHRHWRGLVIDGSEHNIEVIRRSESYWKYDLYADCAFIRRENINELLRRNGFTGDIGLLSIDIDGMDYWVWEAIDVVRPRIVVCEYNSLFGPAATISLPYQANFFRTAAATPRGYFGASIAALEHLGRLKGYCLVAGNSAGNNVFFVRDDCVGSLPVLTPAEAYVQSGFREDRSETGEVLRLDFAQRQASIRDLSVVDVVRGTELILAAIWEASP